MDPRYSKNEKIKQIWATENKLLLWQRTELAVIDARAHHGEIALADAAEIRHVLEVTPIDIKWWKAKDEEIRQDLIAFVEERRRHLPERLRHYFHERLTSFDTEEPAFAAMLRKSVDEVELMLYTLADVLGGQIKRYRFTVMLGETHGQWAELQTFGKRVATWLKAVLVSANNLLRTGSDLTSSKLSGAVGNSPDLSREIQETALASLGFKPFYGATQIMPRECYASVASALGQLVASLVKEATDIRLDARSGRTLIREPFKKTQKGSSRMPHKRNPITLEQMEGMLRMADGYVAMIQKNIQTWQERAIEQSCVERVAWPDLFYVVTHCLDRMAHVLAGLQVYQDEMLQEVIDCRGVYAASKAADFLSEHGLKFDMDPEEAYKIVQLAAFNAFEPSPEAMTIRTEEFHSYESAEFACREIKSLGGAKPPRPSIYSIISKGSLRPSNELAADGEQVRRWNKMLLQIFVDKPDKIWAKWNAIFSFEYNLRGEAVQIDQVLAEAKTLFGN